MSNFLRNLGLRGAGLAYAMASSTAVAPSAQLSLEASEDVVPNREAARARTDEQTSEMSYSAHDAPRKAPSKAEVPIVASRVHPSSTQQHVTEGQKLAETNSASGIVAAPIQPRTERDDEQPSSLVQRLMNEKQHEAYANPGGSATADSKSIVESGHSLTLREHESLANGSKMNHFSPGRKETELAPEWSEDTKDEHRDGTLFSDPAIHAPGRQSRVRPELKSEGFVVDTATRIIRYQQPHHTIPASHSASDERYINVRIGTIEVKAITPPSQVSASNSRSGPALSLDAYLKARNEGRI